MITLAWRFTDALESTRRSQKPAAQALDALADAPGPYCSLMSVFGKQSWVISQAPVVDALIVFAWDCKQEFDTEHGLDFEVNAVKAANHAAKCAAHAIAKRDALAYARRAVKGIDKSRTHVWTDVWSGAWDSAWDRSIARTRSRQNALLEKLLLAALEES